MTGSEIAKALECCFINKNCNGCPCVGFRDCLGIAGRGAVNLINQQMIELQSLREAEKGIVRCKECKHCKMIIDIIGNPSLHCKLSYGLPQVDYDDYCSKGEKMKNEN